MFNKTLLKSQGVHLISYRPSKNDLRILRDMICSPKTAILGLQIKSSKLSMIALI